MFFRSEDDVKLIFCRSRIVVGSPDHDFIGNIFSSSYIFSPLVTVAIAAFLCPVRGENADWQNAEVTYTPNKLSYFRFCLGQSRPEAIQRKQKYAMLKIRFIPSTNANKCQLVQRRHRKSAIRRFLVRHFTRSSHFVSTRWKRELYSSPENVLSYNLKFALSKIKQVRDTNSKNLAPWNHYRDLAESHYDQHLSQDYAY